MGTKPKKRKAARLTVTPVPTPVPVPVPVPVVVADPEDALVDGIDPATLSPDVEQPPTVGEVAAREVRYR